MSDLKAWHRRRDLGESGPAYHAFEHFRDLGPRARSLDRAYTACQVRCPRDKSQPVPTRKEPEPLPSPLLQATATWKEWRRKHLWDARADAWDQNVTEEKRAEAIEAATAMNELHANIARAAMAKVVDRLNMLKGSDLSPGNVVKWMEVAAKLERIARGKPTEIVRREDSGVPDLSKLSEAEIDTLTALLEKAAPAAHE